MIRPFLARGVVRDYILEYLTNNPDATAETAEPAIKERIKGDFAGSPWLPLLLAIVEIMLPLLLELLKSREG